MNTDRPEDAQRQRLREHLESMITRTEKATSWQDAAGSLRGLVNREGYVPIRTRLASEDLDFLEGAREELLGFASLGVKLLDLHQPRDAGGITSDAARPILRCRSCMWRWPCPTFRTMVESLSALRTPTSCQHVEPDHEGDGDGGAGVTLMALGPKGETFRPGGEALPPAGETLRAGDESLRAGDETLRAGDETPAPAVLSAHPGDPAATGPAAPIRRTRDPRLLIYDP